MNEITTPEKEISTALAQAQAFVIRSNDDLALVDAHCAGLLKLKKKIEADFAESKSTTYSAWKAVVAQEKGHLDGVDAARKIDIQKIGAWRDSQEAIRIGEENRLRAEAQKKADDDALALAESLEASGKTEEAEAVIQTPVVVAPVIVPKTTPKTQTVIRKVKKFRVTNEALVPRQYLTLDTVKIGGVVRALGLSANIPGIEVYEEAA